METVAEHAGVSRALVSLVINESPNVSDQKRQAVLRAAQELGYRPNLYARNLAQRRSQTIGVLVNDLHNPFFCEVIDGVEAAAEHLDLRVLILNGGRDPGREQRAVETHLQFQVEALVLIGPRLSDEQLIDAASHAPCVVVAAGRNHPGVDSVTVDDRTGARLAVEHLCGLGHHDIVHVDGGPNISAATRRDAYLAAMDAVGLKPRILAGGDDEADGDGLISSLIETDKMPTAIFAFNDLLAAGLLDQIDDAGLSVPGDVSLVGYDNTFIAAIRHLSLTTINQPRRAMGRLAVQTVLERIEDGRTEPVHHQLQPSLIRRTTTAKPARR